MCEVLDRIENRGKDEGRREGMREGWRKGEFAGIQALMESMHWTAEQAMAMLKIPEQERDVYRAMLQNGTAPA